MSERENLGTGIYAGLSAFLLLICLIGAFVLPASITDSKWLGIPALAAFLLGIPFLFRVAHRSRIRDAVAKAGGTVLHIRRLPYLQQEGTWPRRAFFFGTRFQVDYVDLAGATHRARCNSGFFQGVEWLDDAVIA